jgi:hypothetical protein
MRVTDMEPIAGFITPESSAGLPVLARFLTALPANVAAAYIAAYTQEGDLVVDPFCRSSATALEAARLGRRALLSDISPLYAFIVRASLSPVSAKEMAAGFQRLADSPKGDTSFRSYLLGLYETTCPHCGRGATVHHFVWSRQLDRPVQKVFSCDGCQCDRQEPVDDRDLAILKRVDSRGFHYWAIMERLAPSDEGVKALAQRLLALYTPRNLFALAAVVSKLDVVFDDPRLLDAFRLVLLECMDRGSKLAAASKARPFARGLHPPARFLEVNVWETFEEVYRALVAYQAQARPVPYRLSDGLGDLMPRPASPLASPRPAGEPEVLVRRGSARRLAEDLVSDSAHLILTQPPSVGQGDALSLAYLWSGWVLGKDAAQIFRPDQLLRPRDQEDWPWYLQAMTATFVALARPLARRGHLLLAFVDGELDRVRALLLAAAASDLRLDHLLYQPLASVSLATAATYAGAVGQYYVCFSKGAGVPPAASPPTADALASQVQTASLRAAKELLAQRGEPSQFGWLHNAICIRLAQGGTMRDAMLVRQEGFSALTFLKENIEAGLRKGLKRELMHVPVCRAAPAPERAAPALDGPPVGTDEPDDVPEWKPAGESLSASTAQGEPPAPEALWWLAKPRAGLTPLSDQVEEAVYHALSTSVPPGMPDVAKVIRSLFPGLLTPDPGLLEAVVASYSVPTKDGRCQLREVDQRESRDQEHLSLISLLTGLGHRLGFCVWISRGEQKRRLAGGKGILRDLLDLQERYVSPLVHLPGGTEGADADVVWYGLGPTLYLFEIEWMSCLQSALLERRVVAPNLRRYLVIPDERVDLIRFKLERSVLWGQAIAEDGWDFIKYTRLRQFAGAGMEVKDLPGIVGLEAPVERYGVQLSMF